MPISGHVSFDKEADYEDSIRLAEAAAGFRELDDIDNDIDIDSDPDPAYLGPFPPQSPVAGRRTYGPSGSLDGRTVEDPDTPTYVPGTYYNDGAHIIRPAKP